MKVRATVDGMLDSTTARVEVVPCPTGNPYIDRAAVRQLMKELISESNENLSSPNRLERGGHVYDSAGTLLPLKSPIDPADTPCTNLNAGVRNLPIFIDTHYHPFHPNNASDSLPLAACHWSLPPLGPGKVYGALPGPSDADGVRTYVKQRPSIVFDKDSIYFVPPPDSVKLVPDPYNPPDSMYVPAARNWRTKNTSYPRNAGSCTRP